MADKEKKNTLVINLYAGPSAGKTTCAWELSSLLKKQGYCAEYVPEYAKELVYDENYALLDGRIENELIIMKEKIHRIQRVYGKVDFIVTDSPILQSISFLNREKNSKAEIQDFSKYALNKYAAFNNYNIFVERGERFEEAGRIHNLEQSVRLDNVIKSDLSKYGIEVHDYSQKDMCVAVQDCIKAWEHSLQSKQEPNYVIVQNKTQKNTIDQYMRKENICIQEGHVFNNDFLYEIDVEKKIAIPMSINDVIEDSDKKIQSINAFLGLKKSQSLDDRLKQAGVKAKLNTADSPVKESHNIEEVKSI